MIVEPAPAKINLALHVRARRPDGYHELETLFAFARDGDVVTLTPARDDSLTVIGPFAAALSSAGRETDRHDPSPMPDNLVTRALDAFRTTFRIEQRYAITLDKRLPVASGIGGGSADAAATLRALARLHDVTTGDPRLIAAATALGADVPSCLLGTTSEGTGVGERLVPIDGLPGTPLLLVNPGVAVSTAAVFRGWDGTDRGPLPEGDLLARASAGRNDLHPPALALAPVIADVLAVLEQAPGVLLARMSGSGATCFALFENHEALAPVDVAARERGWWTLATALA